MFFVVLLIFTGSNIFYPLFIGQIPIDCFLEPFFECERWSPAEFALKFRRIDGVSEIVSGTVGNECYEFPAFALRSTELSVHNIAKKTYKVDIFPFVVATDIVRIAVFTSVEYGIDSGSVVFDE